MSKKERPHQPKIHSETKNSLIAIALIGIAVILILAAVDKAGPVGRFIYVILQNLFGWGYYMLPTIAVLVAFLFLIARQRVFVVTSFLGAALFIVSGLGLIDIIFENKGGFLGRIMGLLEIPFGYTASIIISLVLLIAAVLITFNASIKFKKVETEKLAEPAREAPDNEPEEAAITEPEPPIANPAAVAKMDKIKIADDFPMPPARKSPVRAKTYANYIVPPLTLLKTSVEKPTSGDLRANANIIKRTLESFGIAVEMGEINIGPKVTRYTLKPAEGVKISKILTLNQDLALALAAHPIRIEAPIPGKSLVGIEVPNKSAAVVRLGSLMAYPDFKESGPLAFILGRGVSGEPVMADLEKMPHLMVAGSTGSGKSVSIHALLVSLLYKNSPDTLRLALIDPKRVELSIYGGVPHLISPVITDGKKAIGLFRWTINEMERRYEILLEAGARDIGSYNQKSETALPYIVLVVDELADLMAAYGREIESSVVRLAQMARATGIHLVVSTQRPSVEVITGLIKANITARIALQVASQVDSRTILDMAGAEKLLGGGDMLFISSDFSKPKRIQGAYISEEEIRSVAEFIEKNNDTVEEYSFSGDSGNSPVGFAGDSDGDEASDELFQEAVRVVTESKKASASLLQRRLSIGYARAARLLDIMEGKGIIGPGEGAKPREVFINQENSDIN